MKNLILPLLMLLIVSRLHAQDFVYEGPAKPEVRSFWTNAMGIQRTGKIAETLAVMESKMAEVKKKDPSYSTDKMQAEINKWKAKLASTPADKPEDFSNLNPTQKAIKADKLLRKLFEETNISITQRELPTIEFVFNNYKKYLTDYQALNGKAADRDIKRAKTIIGKQVYMTNQAITNLELNKQKGTNAESAEVYYYDAKYHQLYWEAAVAVFPEEASFADQLKVISEVVAKNGSIKDMKAGAEKNNAEKIKTRKLPAPVMKDAALEKFVMDQFNAKYGAEYKGQALKVVLTQADWTINKNTATGAILSRHKTAKLAYKGNDGKCYLLPQYLLIEQPYSGGNSYGASRLVYTGNSGDEMLCENVR
ncbi:MULTISPECIES: hypothetical protein [unclassified Paraflavitalea]|uniref:hypothetical protein n=1 Tax=unclassified Paraflavitalea TaxID=2798305 RepID=UPI003D329984